MSERGILNTVLEPLLVLAFFMAYLEMRVYNMIPLNSPYYVVSSLALISMIGIAAIFVVTGIIEIYGKRTGNEKEMHETAHIARLILYPILVLALLNALGISIASLLVGAGFLGIVIGLAAQTSLGNVFASLAIIYSRPLSRGEKITVVTSYSVQAPSYPHEKMMNEITGTVKHVGLIYTKLLTSDLSMIYIPNSAINQGLIINHSRVLERQIKIRIEAKRTTEIDSFKKRLISKLSREKMEFERLKDLDIKMGLVSTGTNYGIDITARVKVLDYDRVSQWISENAVKSLNEAENKKG